MNVHELIQQIYQFDGRMVEELDVVLRVVKDNGAIDGQPVTVKLEGEDRLVIISE